MCGIVAVLAPQRVEPSRLEAALEALASRGPDGRGRWWSADGTVGVGHTRLAINDPEGGHQPLQDDCLICAVNGEFYGSGPSSRSDSYRLPELTQRHGFAKALRGLRGEFALLCYDQAQHTLYAARDRFGIKPLHWARLGEELWLASKPSALWAAGLKAQWDEDCFWRAAATQYPPPGESLFSQLHSLPPAHWLRVQVGQEPTLQRYWEVPTLQNQAVSGQDFGQALSDAIRLRLRAGHTTAVQLSGGVDSASVLALAHQAQLSDLHAFSVNFGEGPHEGFSEAHLARDLVGQLPGVKHTVLELGSLQVLEGLACAVQQTQGLFVNGHGVAKFELAKAIAREGIKVVLSGEGADELLFGYRHFAPHFPSDSASDPLANPAGLGILTSSQPLVIPSVESRLGFQPGHLSSKLALGRRIQALLDPNFVEGYQPRDPFLEFLDECHLQHLRSPLEISRALWLDSALRGYILEVLGDGCEMAHSLEGRPPFLDHKLWEQPWRLSEQAGSKTPLRQAVAGLVPDTIRLRPKHPFMAPPLGAPLWSILKTKVQETSHPFVQPGHALAKLEELERLEGSLSWEWEPALLWLLSSYHLQELWR